MSICFSCFNEFDSTFDVCPFCGAVRIKKPKEPIQLAPETELCDRYILGPSLGKGGFGIVYKAWDKKLRSIVAVKEFFVSRLMTRAEGEKEVIVNRKSAQEFVYRKKRFLAEARTMAQFGSHPNIPNVFEFFEENGTAYIVMELLKGCSLSEYLMQSGKRLDPGFALTIINEIGKALSSMHEKGIVHRDVAPDNIFICSGHETGIKLMDLGAAKLADETDDVIDIILKPGYSPFEQYDKSDNIGPWTDVYALGATLYFIMTGKKPDESTNRKIEDVVVPPHELYPAIPENLSNAIMKALAVDIHMRFKDVNTFLEAVNGERKVESLEKEKKRRSFRRASGIIAAILAVAIVCSTVSVIFLRKKQGIHADITLWYIAEYDSDKDRSIKSVVENFNKTYPKVKITLNPYTSSDEYEEALLKAAESGELPTLFESSGISDEILEKASDVTAVLESEYAQECYFLDQYDSYYNNARKQIPLGIEVPMVCVITNGEVYSGYTGDLFETVSQISDAGFMADDETDGDIKLEGVDPMEYISVDGKHSGLIEANFGKVGNYDEDEFFENSTAVLFTSTMEMKTVKEHTSSYAKEFAFCIGTADYVKCDFVYEWSIGNGKQNEIEAAEQLLSWMLGESVQECLMISECQDGQIPINKTAFDNKLKYDLEPILKTQNALRLVPIGNDTAESVTAEQSEAVSDGAGE